MNTSIQNDPSLLILISLAEGPRHGYAIMTDIAEFSGARMGPGTLYGAIARLESQGLIEPLAGDDRRRPYRLTPAGLQALQTTISGIRDLARTAEGRLAA